MKITKMSQLKHGQKAVCQIYSNIITDTQICVSNYNLIFICHNLEFDSCHNYGGQLGYQKSFCVVQSDLDNGFVVIDTTKFPVIKFGDKVIIKNENKEGFVLRFDIVLDTCLVAVEERGEDYSISYYSLSQLTLVQQANNQKPALLNKGARCKVLENAQECGLFGDWSQEKKNLIGKVVTIDTVFDHCYGISYRVSHKSLNTLSTEVLPHYCLQKIDNKITKQSFFEKFGIEFENIEIVD